MSDANAHFWPLMKKMRNAVANPAEKVCEVDSLFTRMSFAFSRGFTYTAPVAPVTHFRKYHVAPRRPYSKPV
jgi:hypothetical protein